MTIAIKLKNYSEKDHVTYSVGADIIQIVEAGQMLIWW